MYLSIFSVSFVDESQIACPWNKARVRTRMFTQNCLLIYQQKAFAVDSRTAAIKVHTSLDRETLSRAVLVVNVTDTNAAKNSDQTSTGSESLFFYSS